MTSYPDPSLTVSAFTEEAATPLADGWMASLRKDDLMFSAWCLTEVISALAGKVRARSLTRGEAARLSSAIPALFRDTGKELVVERRHFASAAALLERSFKPLKAGDALHLAIAADASAKLWTLDRRMAEAGQALGLDVELLR